MRRSAMSKLVILLGAVLAAPVGAQESAAQQEEIRDEAAALVNPAADRIAAVIVAQLRAFNAADVEAMVANLSDDFAWFAVDSDAMTLELRGRDAFRQSMLQYFNSIAGARAEIESLFVVGNYVTARERAYWLQGGQEYSQASLAVYEVVEDRIRRVWYYPAFE